MDIALSAVEEAAFRRFVESKLGGAGIMERGIAQRLRGRGLLLLVDNLGGVSGDPVVAVELTRFGRDYAKTLDLPLKP